MAKQIVPKKKTAVVVKKNAPTKAADKGKPTLAKKGAEKEKDSLPPLSDDLSAEQQLLAVTKIAPRTKKESFDDYAGRLATAVDELEEEVWDTLGEPAQKWYTEAVDALNNDKSPDPFPEPEPEGGDGDGGDGEGGDEYDADDLAVLTLVCADLEVDAETVAKKAKKKVPDAEEDRVLDLHQIAHTVIHVLEELGWSPGAGDGE